MISLGIAPVKTSELDKDFLNIASVLGRGEVPGEVWAVYYLGEIIAIYLTSDEAYASLKIVMQSLDAKVNPTIQTRIDALLIRSKSDEAAASNPPNAGNLIKLAR